MLISMLVIILTMPLEIIIYWVVISIFLQDKCALASTINSQHDLTYIRNDILNKLF